MKGPALIVLIYALCGFGLTSYSASDTVPEAVLGSNGIAATGSGDSSAPFIAGDGSRVVFTSAAENLVLNDLLLVRLPGDVASELRILTLTSLSTGAVTAYWNALPGRTYRIEYKDRLGEPGWQQMAGDVVATGYTAAKTDVTAGMSASRFYRVRLID